MAPDDKAVERVWSNDRQVYFAIIEAGGSAYKIVPYALMTDVEESVHYWCGHQNQPESIFGNLALARKEATRLLEREGYRHA